MNDVRMLSNFTPVDAPSDISGNIRSLDELIKRADIVHSQLSAQIARLYGEGEPPAAAEKLTPSPVGLHFEMTSRIGALETLLGQIEAKAARLSAYA